ncbi:MAG: hypothetical protein ACKVT0_04340, partial [Planctomycetaceae bacterium]
MSLGLQKDATVMPGLQSSFGEGLVISDASILIFGASGDLTARKLIPALFLLWKDGFLADNVPIIGVARRPKTDEEFRNELQADVSEHARSGPISAEQWQAFAERLHYQQVDIAQSDSYAQLKSNVEQLEQAAGLTGNRLVYLATTPELF